MQFDQLNLDSLQPKLKTRSTDGSLFAWCHWTTQKYREITGYPCVACKLISCKSQNTTHGAFAAYVAVRDA
ncbi:hypothetical protein XENTR_v10011929 [Xenopus tropicalis]|nr:hypothetical protein XENTR_v10011929 [Xenopus tropicalis]